MEEGTDSIVAEPPRPIRKEPGQIRSKIGEVRVEQYPLRGVVMGPGHYMHAIDGRVEHIESRLEIET